jgi:hypothetical protein
MMKKGGRVRKNESGGRVRKNEKMRKKEGRKSEEERVEEK